MKANSPGEILLALHVLYFNFCAKVNVLMGIICIMPIFIGMMMFESVRGLVAIAAGKGHI